MDIDQVLNRGVSEVFPTKEGLKKLMQEKKITLYQGFDPSMPSLHLGNFVGLMKLRQFQQLGHRVIFLVGDFTGMIGDPTDKSATRKQLTREQVLKNAAQWKEQASKVLDFSGNNPAEIIFNSEWNDKVTFKDLIEITSNFTVQQMIERDMFQNRLKNNQPIYLHEFLYPVAQGYDSVVMKVDLEIGGSDQIFNMLAGRDLSKAMLSKDKYVLATKLLVDKDGNKVGKTTGNALFLDSTPSDFFGGIMTFPDEVLHLAYELLTEIDLKGLDQKIKEDPMNIKKSLAYEIVKFLWGNKDADKAQKDFEDTFQNKQIPSDLNEVKVVSGQALSDIINYPDLVTSKSEAKRLIKQGAVEYQGKVISDSQQIIDIPSEGAVIKIGKKRFVKLIRK